MIARSSWTKIGIAGLSLLVISGSRLFWLSSNQIDTSGSPIVLEPISSVVIAGTDSATFRSFVATNDGLYFLFTTKTSAEIVRTDLQGSIKERIQLPADPKIGHCQDISVDSSGKMAILQGGRPSKIYILNADGAVNDQFSLTTPVGSIAFLGPQLVSLDQLHSTLLLEPGEIPKLPLTPPLSDFAVLVQMPNKAAIFENGIPRLRVVDLQSTLLNPLELTAPEIQGVLRTKYDTPDIVEQIVSSATGDGAGNLFCAISPYSTDTGARIVEFSSDGALRRRFRCKLPAFDSFKEKSNPGGHMLVSTIAVVGHTLYISSDKHHMVASYTLPN